LRPNRNWPTPIQITGGYSRLNGLAAQLMSHVGVTGPAVGRGACLVAGRSGTASHGSSAAPDGRYAGCQDRLLTFLGLLPGTLSGASRPPAAGTV
jgi:hypothetical protein